MAPPDRPLDRLRQLGGGGVTYSGSRAWKEIPCTRSRKYTVDVLRPGDSKARSALDDEYNPGLGPARTRFQASARRGLTRFVGRDAELDQLRRAKQLAGDGRGQVAAIVGEAGVGKSRLVYEFSHSHRLQGWLTLESASVSYGKATS